MFPCYIQLHATFVIQPCNQVMFRAFKIYYWHKTGERSLGKFENKQDISTPELT